MQDTTEDRADGLKRVDLVSRLTLAADSMRDVTVDWAEAQAILELIHAEPAAKSHPSPIQPETAHSKSEYKRRVALGDPNIRPPQPETGERAAPEVQSIMFGVYDYAKVSDGFDEAEGAERTAQRLRMQAQADKIRAMLAALSASAVPASGAVWQEIETAPKDGTAIGVWSVREPALVRIVRWGRHLEGLAQPFGWVTISRAITISNLPTHWMPLSPPPAAKEPTP